MTVVYLSNSHAEPTLKACRRLSDLQTCMTPGIHEPPKERPPSVTQPKTSIVFQSQEVLPHIQMYMIVDVHEFTSVR